MAVDIVPLELRHVPALLRLYCRSSGDYSRHFTPFPFDSETFRRILEKRKRDRFYAVMIGPAVAGFYMLRGFDQGYTTPAYGVWIGEEYSRRGLALATLQHAVSVCQGLGCSDLMLKVHPDNQRAKDLYERFGFEHAGFDRNNGNHIYKLRLAGN